MRFRNRDGLTLVELLISLAILGIIMVGLQDVMGTAMMTYNQTSEKQDLLAQARFALDRMALFVRECDAISKPDQPTGQEILKVSERVLDTYDNSSQAYDLDGDDFLDADNDADGIVNEDDTTPDPKEWVTFDLDKTDASNWKLHEQRPDYSTATLDDYTATTVIAEHVTAFATKLMTANLVQIELTLTNGQNQVALTTRIRAGRIE